MQFDEQHQEFVLDPEDFFVLGLPQECNRWPMQEIEDLVEQVEVAQARIDSLDETQFPLGSSLHEMRIMGVKHQRILQGIRTVIAQNAVLGDDTIQKLLDE